MQVSRLFITLVDLYVMFCAISYHLYNLENLKNTHGGLSLSLEKKEERKNTQRKNKTRKKNTLRKKAENANDTT